MARLLLVEDSVSQRRAIEHLLAGASYQVESVGDVRTAWESLERGLPDVVVTDLNLPEVDGLTLLRRIRDRGWRLPVVVITEFGSEQVAASALRAGATSYVPKQYLDAELLETIDELLNYVAGSAGFEHLMSCARRAQFEFQLDNDPALIPPLIDLVQHMVATIGHFPRHEHLQWGVAFEQALHNAMFRGNLELPGPGPVNWQATTHLGPNVHLERQLREATPGDEWKQRRRMAPYAERKIHVLVTIEPREVRLHLQDEGPGFDYPRLLSELRRHEEPRARAAGPQGRGLVLMQAFLDELQYLGRGNEVRLTKRSRLEIPDTPAAATSDGSNSTTVTSSVGGPMQALAGRHATASLPTLATLRSIDDGTVWAITTPRATIGREESCDVVIHHHDVSAHHCQLFLHEGWWFVSDLRTKNGIRVNGIRVTKRRLGPQDTLSVARHKLVIDYDPGALGAVGPTPPPDPF